MLLAISQPERACKQQAKGRPKIGPSCNCLSSRNKEANRVAKRGLTPDDGYLDKPERGGLSEVINAATLRDGGKAANILPSHRRCTGISRTSDTPPCPRLWGITREPAYVDGSGFISRP